MNRRIAPPSKPPTAYRLPWHVSRDDRMHPSVANTSDEAADFVRVFRDARDAGLTTELWGQIPPSETVDLCLCGADLDEVVVTLAWFRPSDGLEYVWRFVV